MVPTGEIRGRFQGTDATPHARLKSPGHHTLPRDPPKRPRPVPGPSATPYLVKIISIEHHEARVGLGPPERHLLRHRPQVLADLPRVTDLHQYVLGIQGNG